MSTGTRGGTFFAFAAAAGLLLLLMPYVLMFGSGRTGLVGTVSPHPSVRGDGDPYEHSWQFWWVGRAVGEGEDPRYCPLVYWPDGASLAYDHVGWFDTLLFGLAGLGESSPGLAHTLSLVTGTLLTAIFGWLLARSWGAGRYGALFAGLALAWLPSRTAHLFQHYQIANLWAFPAALWAASRFMAGSRRIFVPVFFIAVLAGGMESPFIALFVIICLPAVKWAAGGEWRTSVPLVVSWFAAAALTGIFLITSPGSTGELSHSWREAVIWAAEPQSFVLPSPFGTAAGLFGMNPRASWMTNSFEGVVTPGLTILFLFVLYMRRQRNWRLTGLIAVLWILSLGPELRLLGRPLGVPLPFRILQFLPVMEGIRTPSRFAIPGSVLMVICAGILVSRLKGRWKPAAFSLLLLEMALPSLPMLHDGIPEECGDVPPGSVVLELPVDQGVRIYSWFQTGGDYARRYAFMARLPEMTEEEALVRNALAEDQVLIYHRWLYCGDELEEYDSRYGDLFPGSSPSDSVWMRQGGSP